MDQTYLSNRPQSSTGSLLDLMDNEAPDARGRSQPEILGSRPSSSSLRPSQESAASSGCHASGCSAYVLPKSIVNIFESWSKMQDAHGGFTLGPNHVLGLSVPSKDEELERDFVAEALVFFDEQTLTLQRPVYRQQTFWGLLTPLQTDSRVWSKDNLHHVFKDTPLRNVHLGLIMVRKGNLASETARWALVVNASSLARQTPRYSVLSVDHGLFPPQDKLSAVQGSHVFAMINGLFLVQKRISPESAQKEELLAVFKHAFQAEHLVDLYVPRKSCPRKPEKRNQSEDEVESGEETETPGDETEMEEEDESSASEALAECPRPGEILTTNLYVMGPSAICSAPHGNDDLVLKILRRLNWMPSTAAPWGNELGDKNDIELSSRGFWIGENFFRMPDPDARGSLGGPAQALQSIQDALSEIDLHELRYVIRREPLKSQSRLFQNSLTIYLVMVIQDENKAIPPLDQGFRQKTITGQHYAGLLGWKCVMAYSNSFRDLLPGENNRSLDERVQAIVRDVLEKWFREYNWNFNELQRNPIAQKFLTSFLAEAMTAADIFLYPVPEPRIDLEHSTSQGLELQTSRGYIMVPQYATYLSPRLAAVIAAAQMAFNVNITFLPWVTARQKDITLFTVC